jgi:two-component system nitrogen regulation sensor histidine kinase NtrY
MNDIMPGRLKDIRIVFIALLVAVALAVVSDYLYFSDLEWKYRTSRLDKQLIEKEKKAIETLARMEMQLSDGSDPSEMFYNKSGSGAQEEGVTLLIYKEERIVYWSDNTIAFPFVFQPVYDTHKPVFISNGWFIPEHRRFADYDLLALISVYKQYPIVNSLLGQGFPESFRLPAATKITFNEKETSFHINGIEKEFHFGLVFPDRKPNTIFIIIPVLFWLVFLLLLMRFVMLACDWLGQKTKKTVSLPIGLAVLLLVFVIVLTAGLPASVRSTELFSPFFWSAGRLLPSVGHVTLLGLLLVAGMNLIFREDVFNYPRSRNGSRGEVIAGIMIAAGFVFFLAAEVLFRDLVLNSAISFEAYKILDLSFMSLAGFISVLLVLSISVIFFFRAYRMMAAMSLKKNLIVTAAASLTLPLSCLISAGCTYWGLIYAIVMALILLYWQRKALSMLSLIAVLAGLTGIFSTAVILKYSQQKEDKNLKVMAITLANDNDMVAEDMLIDLWPEMKRDTILTTMMHRTMFSPANISAIYSYLETKYFNGYWENYDLNIVICRSDSPLEIAETGSYASNCFKYFDDRIKNEGDSITGTGFWFMHNQSGRAYYFSRLFFNISDTFTNGLFIELISHIETYLAGYPELLLDASHQRFLKLRGISYAKYSDSTLVLRSGDYPYDNLIVPPQTDDEYCFVKTNGYKHLYYDRGEMTLMITVKALTPLDAIITFAYLFIVVLIFSLILLLFVIKHPHDLLRFDTFRRRLQLAFVAVLSIVFIIIIAGALVLSTKQFMGNHTRILREKLTSVSIELDHKLSAEQTLAVGWHTPEYQSLNQLLVRFSNIFFTDINLYSPSGYLLATSRPEVFTRRLEGRVINPEAYGYLSDEEKNEYICEEKIGKLEYLSAYMPFYNENNKLLAYINLPYFAMQDILTGEISNLVVTLVNFTLLLLMLMMWFAVFLSERITSPLIMVQRAMASVEYGKKNEHIGYKSRDEVGGLIREYNRMIDELEESANRLARSEREMAWREMARQIAHEIKNPLTPMKLNVQQLFKWWNDKAPDFDGKIRNFTDNQIEYINNLSNIATAFSYFARLPGAEPTEVDLLAQLRTTLDIFGNADNTIITLDSGNISKAVVMADREHLNSIFSNLLKNALQAIPADKQGIITVTLSATFDRVKVRISDNGTGIPEELKSKIFTPNFTTKSSGMGLGLSIAKRYAETAGGTILFESEHDKGSSFIVELPLLYTVERTEKKSI